METKKKTTKNLKQTIELGEKLMCFDDEQLTCSIERSNEIRHFITDATAHLKNI